MCSICLLVGEAQFILSCEWDVDSAVRAGNGKCPSRATVPSSGQAEQWIDEEQQERADLPHITEPASFSIAYGFIYTYQTVIGIQICFLDQGQSNHTGLQLVLHEILLPVWVKRSHF